jgi:peptidoglycan/xylan/chitin deacetylase (PgdA/CDA1 family)
MRLALKIDIDTHLGTREGVPRLIEMLERNQAGATFLFSLGPDHTGRALKRVLRPGFFRKVARTSVIEHYGLRTLLYGTLLPGPDIGRRDAGIMREARTAGFEVGVHAYDHVKWQDGVAHGDQAWTRRQMRLACDRFEEIFAERPAVHGAAGWQMNPHAYALLAELGFRYASDTRGLCPFVPAQPASTRAVPQLPTTLPTLDEMIGVGDVTPANVAARLLDLTKASCPAAGHVYTLHAELEGMQLRPVFQALVQGWREQGYRLCALREYAAALDVATLPRHAVRRGSVPGRSGEVAMQSEEVSPGGGEHCGTR